MRRRDWILLLLTIVLTVAIVAVTTLLLPGPEQPLAHALSRFAAGGAVARLLGPAPTGLRALARTLGGGIFLLLFWGLLLYLLPRRMTGMTSSLTWRGLGRTLLVGLAVTLLALALVVLSVLTRSTLMLTLPLVCGLLLVGHCGAASLAVALGCGMRRLLGSVAVSVPLLELTLGTLVIYGLGYVPILRLLIGALVIVLALGVAVRTRMGSGKPWSLSPLVQTGDNLPSEEE
ncbi:MAG: hypothetical protein ACE5OS_00300 [Anaerolineae bacterium]